LLASRNGQLSIELTAAPDQYAIGSKRIGGILYNCVYVPPVWHVKPGDTLMVALHNRLPEPTNLHFLGGRLPSASLSLVSGGPDAVDGPRGRVARGERFVPCLVDGRVLAARGPALEW
jgi:FtsP/CotA-like multicopper oxidase with cupredoxin domain